MNPITHTASAIAVLLPVELEATAQHAVDAWRDGNQEGAYVVKPTRGESKAGAPPLLAFLLVTTAEWENFHRMLADTVRIFPLDLDPKEVRRLLQLGNLLRAAARNGASVVR